MQQRFCPLLLLHSMEKNAEVCCDESERMISYGIYQEIYQ